MTKSTERKDVTKCIRVPFVREARDEELKGIKLVSASLPDGRKDRIRVEVKGTSFRKATIYLREHGLPISYATGGRLIPADYTSQIINLLSESGKLGELDLAGKVTF